jgi:hypothetical protein
MVLPGSKQKPLSTMVRHATLWQSFQSQAILCSNAQRCLICGLVIAIADGFPLSGRQQANWLTQF